MHSRHIFAAALLCLAACAADPNTGGRVRLAADDIAYEINAGTLEIVARIDSGAPIVLTPPLRAGGEAPPIARDGAISRWNWEEEGYAFEARTEAGHLSLTITGDANHPLNWALPVAAPNDTWLIPDGQGVAFAAQDGFWRATYAEEHCLGNLSFPAWGKMDAEHAITFALGDGLQSELCLRDESGVQARVTHPFGAGVETFELLLHVGTPDPLAPALAYRRILESRGALKRFADKEVPRLARLYGAPHAYVWGDGRTTAFLDALHALGVKHMVLSYDQDTRNDSNVAGAAFLARADQLGYLAGPYETFANAQPPATADTPLADWGSDLFPAGCVRRADGEILTGFAGRGCQLSSEALRQRSAPPTPASRYEAHAREGASQVFLDVDGFGELFADYSPAHPMTMARDRENRLARMSIAIAQFQFVLGSENNAAWSTGVTHYSHGSAQAHLAAVWPLLQDRERFGRYWPAERPTRFFRPMRVTPEEDRALFSVPDRLPLFEAVFHDALVTTDRWEFGLMKFQGLERRRFARALLYGAPTIWNLDQRELARVGPWLRAAHDAFARAHGDNAPQALTGFSWLTPDRLVQQTEFADGRVIVANFSAAAWQGLAPDCVRVTPAGAAAFELCPPAD